MKSLRFGLCLLFAAAGAFAADPQAPHFVSAPCADFSALAFQAGLAFTGGRDGSLLVWELASRRPLQRLQISFLPIRRIAVSPDGRACSLVESDGKSVHFLSVWDWRSGRRLFLRPLVEAPLIMQYSPKGSFIVVSKTDWNSLTFIHPQQGKKLEVLSDGFGIVSFLYVNERESSMVTYAPTTGAFTYWNLANGARKGEASRRLPGLLDLGLLNSRFAAALGPETLELVDIVEGAPVFRAPLGPGPHRLRVDPASSAIFVYTDLGSAGRARVFKLEADGLKESFAYEHAGLAALGEFEPLDGQFYFPLRGGGLFRLSPAERAVRAVIPVRIKPIDSILAWDDAFLASTSASIFRFRAPAGTGSAPFSVSRWVNPFAAPAGLIRTEDSRLLCWKIEGNALAELDQTTGRVTRMLELEGQPLVQIDFRGGKLFTLDKAGAMLRIDYSSGAVEYRHPAPGLRCLEAMDHRRVFAGRTSTGPDSSPLLIVDTLTGETVPIRIAKLETILALAWEPVSNRLYYYGVENDGGNRDTVLGFCQGPRFDRPRLLDKDGQVDAGGALHASRLDGALYAGFASERIRAYPPAGRRELPAAPTIPLRIQTNRYLILALGLDGGVTAWRRDNSARLGHGHATAAGDWVFLSDFSWAAAPPGFDEAELRPREPSPAGRVPLARIPYGGS